MINLSLSTLGDVIKALSQRSAVGNSPKHIPYRNSILTWLLKDCIGGNSRTTILATISPIASSYAESLNTIRFITKAKYIVNKVNINDKLNHTNDQSYKLIEEMKYQLLNCEKRIFELQKIIENNGLMNQVSVMESNIGSMVNMGGGINIASIGMGVNMEMGMRDGIEMDDVIAPEITEEEEEEENEGNDTSRDDNKPQQ